MQTVVCPSVSLMFVYTESEDWCTGDDLPKGSNFPRAGQGRMIAAMGSVLHSPTLSMHAVALHAVAIDVIRR